MIKLFLKIMKNLIKKTIIFIHIITLYIQIYSGQLHLIFLLFIIFINLFIFCVCLLHGIYIDTEFLTNQLMFLLKGLYKDIELLTSQPLLLSGVGDDLVNYSRPSSPNPGALVIRPSNSGSPIPESEITSLVPRPSNTSSSRPLSSDSVGLVPFYGNSGSGSDTNLQNENTTMERLMKLYENFFERKKEMHDLAFNINDHLDKLKEDVEGTRREVVIYDGQYAKDQGTDPQKYKEDYENSANCTANAAYNAKVYLDYMENITERINNIIANKRFVSVGVFTPHTHNINDPIFVYFTDFPIEFENGDKYIIYGGRGYLDRDELLELRNELINYHRANSKVVQNIYVAQNQFNTLRPSLRPDYITNPHRISVDEFRSFGDKHVENYKNFLKVCRKDGIIYRRS